MSSTKQSRWIKSKTEYGREGPAYKWWQTETELSVTIPVGEGIKGKDVVYQLKPNHLQVGIKGKPLLVDGDLTQSVVVDESSWILDDGAVEITIQKGTSDDIWWASLIKGHPQIDVKRIESSKYLDDSLLQKLAEKDEEEERKKKESEENPKEEEKK